MFYEQVKEKKKRKKRIGCIWPLTKLLVFILVVFMAAGVIKGNIADKIIHRAAMDSYAADAGLPSVRMNVLLLGLDSSSNSRSRADSIMILSIGLTGDIRLVSIQRDTLVPIEGHGMSKINAAYAWGGEELILRTVNKAFGLNLIRYAAIDYAGFAELVDVLGGIETDVTADEMKAMNAMGKSNRLENHGEGIMLNGAQALRYCRIRKLDSDYKRTARQRTVITAILEKIKKQPYLAIGAVGTLSRRVKTNVSSMEIFNCALTASINGNRKDMRLPADGTFESGKKDGVWSIRPDLNENSRILKDFLYG